MTFKPDEVSNFQALFAERKDNIRAFDGCMHLELWQDVHSPQVFFTYSVWQSESHLDHYRYSDFFKDTWAQTKALFAEKPSAWSVREM